MDVTLKELTRVLLTRLRESHIDNASLDIRLLVQKATGWDRTEQILNEGAVLEKHQSAALEEFVARRISGEPIDHILGSRAFYGRDFIVTKDVLSPRPETEGLVDEALAFIKDIQSPNILDLGTGSGAIILTLLSERSDAKGVAVDLSEAALTIARQNADKLGVAERVTFVKGSWFEPVTGPFDMIVSNPPYITDAAMEALMPEVKNFDPDMALRGGSDGLGPYHIIVGQAATYLKPGGALIVEIGYDQGASVADMFTHHGFHDVRVHKDLSGHNRVVMGISAAK